jgi:hypothetical protein
MAGSILLSSAYFPPVSYFSRLKEADVILVEREENYLKQTYRNRCRILGANGPETLTVPVVSASFRKTPVKDVRIDYSRRWQKIHIGALTSAYRSSAFFEFYFDNIEYIISSNEKFLLDLNMRTLEIILKWLKIKAPAKFTTRFEPISDSINDIRYGISPKIKSPDLHGTGEYFQVFGNKFGFVSDLSILDLIFNAGPDSLKYL